MCIRDRDYIILDTVGRALDTLTLSLLKNPKNSNHAGGLSLPGYGALKNTFTAWLRTIRATGRTVILVAHSTEQMRGDDTVQRLDVQGSSKDFVYQFADVMGRVEIQEGKRVFNTTPSMHAFGKDPSGVGIRNIPTIPAAPHVLHEWLTEIRDNVRKRGEKKSEAASAAEEMRKKADACKTPEELTALALAAKKEDLSPAVKLAVVASANAKGWHWDRDAYKVAVEKKG